MADHEDYDLPQAELEAELDLVYPDWDMVISRDDPHQAVKARPFQGLPLATLMRLKWLLLRRQILVAGETSGVLITPNGRDPRKCFAVPIKKEEGVDLPEPPAKVTT